MATEFRAGNRLTGGTQRAVYRVRQFCQAVLAQAQPLGPAEIAEVQAALPEKAWPLFMKMGPGDQRHSLHVFYALQQQGYRDPRLVQAALLHDCAKHGGGVRLWHRVAVVLLAVFWPGLIAHWTQAPPRTSWRHPFWVYVHHPECGAELAAAAGCNPLAIRLIAQHQDHRPRDGADPDPDVERWLPVLQAADDDN